jgi:hypothetical protein
MTVKRTFLRRENVQNSEWRISGCWKPSRVEQVDNCLCILQVNIGMEAFAFCSLLVIILIIGGLVSLYEAITATANAPQGESLTVAPIVEQQEDDTHNQVPSSMMPPGSAELPPPPYHIAIMLPSQNDTESVQVIRDSPPPSYEKAVT